MRKNKDNLEKAWNNFEKTGSIADYMEYSSIRRDLFEDRDF